MHKIVITLFACLAGMAVSEAAVPQQRVVGGSSAYITAYPFAAALLRSQNNGNHLQQCVGSILTTKSILTVAGCFNGENSNSWSIRVGSSLSNTGGAVYKVKQIIIHPNYNPTILDSDIAILRTSTNIVYNNTVKAGVISGVNYVLTDHQPVWTIGWGATYYGGPPSAQLKQALIWTVNQTMCSRRYQDIGYTVTSNMLCAGWLDVGGRGPCTYDAGSPLLHDNVIVGVASWGYGCGSPTFPAVSTRISHFTTWIQANA